MFHRVFPAGRELSEALGEFFDKFVQGIVVEDRAAGGELLQPLPDFMDAARVEVQLLAKLLRPDQAFGQGVLRAIEPDGEIRFWPNVCNPIFVGPPSLPEASREFESMSVGQLAGNWLKVGKFRRRQMKGLFVIKHCPWAVAPDSGSRPGPG